MQCMGLNLMLVCFAFTALLVYLKYTIGFKKENNTKYKFQSLLGLGFCFYIGTNKINLVFSFRISKKKVSNYKNIF